MDIHPVHAHICARVCSPSVCVPPPPPVHTHVQRTISGLALCWEALSCPQMSPHPEVTHRAVVPHCGRSRPAVPHGAPCCPIVSRCAPPHPFIPTALCWAPLCPTVPHGAVLCPLVSYRAPLCCTASHCAPLCPLVPHCALLCPVISHCAPLCPIVPCCAHLYPIVPHCAILGHTVSHCAPLCPITSCCALLCPLIPPVPHRAPSYPIVPSDIPLCSAAPYCLTAPCRAPLHPVVPHCSLSCPPVPLCGPTVHNPTPRCPAVPHCAPRSPPWCSGPPPAPHSSHSPAAIPPPRDGGTGLGWQGVVPSIPCAPPRRGPPPGHPAVPVTQALAVLPAKMEAAVLLQLWALAGKWQPRHQRGDTAGGTPWGGGWGDPQRLGVPMGELGKSVLSLGTGGVGTRGQGGPLCVVGAG